MSTTFRRRRERRDTAANWTDENPVLAGAEWGVEEDTGQVKLGDGVTAWVDLSYFAGTGDGEQGEQGEPGERGDDGAPGTFVSLWRGGWEEGFYEAGSIVTHDGSTWFTATETDLEPSPMSPYWVVLAARGTPGLDGESGESGTVISSFQGPWAPGTYPAGSVVTNNGNTWLALNEVDTEALPSDAFWALLASAGTPGTDGVDGEDGEDADPGATSVTWGFALSDEITPIAAGLKLTIRAPHGLSLTEIRASLTNAGSTATVFDVTVNSTSLFSTPLTIDAGTTASADAAVPPVITGGGYITDWSEVAIWIDEAGVGAVGAKVYLIGTPG